MSNTEKLTIYVMEGDRAQTKLMYRVLLDAYCTAIWNYWYDGDASCGGIRAAPSLHKCGLGSYAA